MPPRHAQQEGRQSQAHSLLSQARSVQSRREQARRRPHAAASLLGSVRSILICPRLSWQGCKRSTCRGLVCTAWRPRRCWPLGACGAPEHFTSKGAGSAATSPSRDDLMQSGLGVQKALPRSACGR